jgi:hypothetical protein
MNFFLGQFESGHLYDSSRLARRTALASPIKPATSVLANLAIAALFGEFCRRLTSDSSLAIENHLCVQVGFGKAEAILELFGTEQQSIRL